MKYYEIWFYYYGENDEKTDFNKEFTFYIKMDREIILKALRIHEDGIMQFTLGEVTVDEDETIKCSDIYSSEWENHSEEIAVSIENILCSNMPLKPDMLVGIIVNEWFNCVGSDVEDLNYYGLLGVAIEIIDYIERYQCKDDNE